MIKKKERFLFTFDPKLTLMSPNFTFEIFIRYFLVSVSDIRLICSPQESDLMKRVSLLN